MEEETKKCNFVYSNAVNCTEPYIVLNLLLKKYRNILFKHLIYMASRVPSIYSLARPLFRQARVYPQVQAVYTANEPLNLKPGDWVEVRPAEEIFSTLDERGRYKGLYFMPEMRKHCGKRFKVFKNVKKIMLESTGEMRKIVSPTVFLEANFCEGEYDEGCDRSCFFYWREEWLKRSTPPADASEER